MTHSPKVLSCAALLCGATLVGLLNADTLILRNGQAVEGSYVGGSAGMISFNTAAGTSSIPVTQVASVTFAQQPAPPPAPPPAVAAAPISAQDVTIPAGTLLIVRMQQQVTSDNEPGTNFVATLETDLVSSNGIHVAPAGTKIYGTVTKSQHARRLFGHAELELALNQILLNGVAMPIMTGNFEEAAAGSGAKTLGAAAVGAGVGAIADGSDGARTGAAVGLGVAVLKKGDSVVVPVNAILQFQLRDGLTVHVGH